MATPKAFTDSVVSTMTAKRGQSGWREVADGGCRGLRLRISPHGEKVWCVQMQVGTNRERKTLGAYPEITLADARRRASEIRAAAREGVGPDALEVRRKAERMTVSAGHTLYIDAQRLELRANTVALKEGMFSQHIEPVIGKRLVRNIRRTDVVEVVDAVKAKGFRVQSNRVFSELMALLRWLEQRQYLDGVPTFHKFKAKEQSRRRTLPDAEIREVWHIAADLGDLTRDFSRLVLLLGQRRDEIRLMTFQEVHFEDRLWIIPGSRYKTGIDHVVPLSDPALTIIKSRYAKGATGYVLPGKKDGQPFNGAASAMRRLRKELPARADFTWHDLRRTMRTGLSRLGVDKETAELCIGHLPEGMAAVYDMYTRLDERREAMKRWGQFVLSVIGEADLVAPTKKPTLLIG